MDEKLTGSAYIAVVGGETEVSACRDSIERLQKREGDVWSSIRGTKGYETRQSHVNRFMSMPQVSWLFMLDGDMIIPPDALERLREHGKPFVAGFYMRRRYDPIAPVWFEPSDTLPFIPMARKVKEELIEIGASGWGCTLIHRCVFDAMLPILKGEPFIIEDDMDVWPYDLREVLAGRERLRVLRGVKDVIMGSDVRFAFYARAAGFPLYGDGAVKCGHMLNYPVSVDDFNAVPDTYIQKLADKYAKDHTEEVERIEAARKAIENG